MKFIEEYLDLNKKQKLIRRDMQQKRKAITCEISPEGLSTLGSECSCIQKMDALGIGLGLNFTQIEIAFCDVFCDDDYCPNKYCHMCRKNHAYIDSVKLYKSVKQAKRNLIKDALKFKSK